MFPDSPVRTEIDTKQNSHSFNTFYWIFLISNKWPDTPKSNTLTIVCIGQPRKYNNNASFLMNMVKTMPTRHPETDCDKWGREVGYSRR